jgi:CNT family concentrative nucleoside transporter
MAVVQALLGLSVFIGLAILLSENRRAISWQFIGIGLVIQIIIAVALLKVDLLQTVLLAMNDGVVVLNDVTLRATRFMFGFLAGGEAPYAIENPQANVIVAFQVLPLILVVSALSSLLFYWGILPWLIRGLAKLLIKVFRISGELSFGASSTLFMGTVEAPLLIKPYLKAMPRSDLLALLSCTMATIAGTVLVLYASVVETVLANAVGHLLIASLISIPAALVLAHCVCPGEVVTDSGQVELVKDSQSAMDAIIKGTRDGLSMVLNIAAVIIVFFALIYLTNEVLALLPPQGHWQLESLLGSVLRPFMWLIGVPWAETGVAGELMATKIVLNEFVAYLNLSQLPADALSPASFTLVTYAICGFANLGSMGIIIGGLGALLPERRQELIQLTGKSLVIGNLATLMSAAVIGLIL